MFHSDQTPPLGFNRGYYSNPDVDRLIDLATQSTSEADRATALPGRTNPLAEDAPYIPIWNRTNVIVAQPSLDGLHLNAIGDFQSLRDVRRHDPVVSGFSRTVTFSPSGSRARCGPQPGTASRGASRRSP